MPQLFHDRGYMIQKSSFLRRIMELREFRILIPIWVLGGALLLADPSAAAAVKTPLRIGYVNLSLLLHEMPQTAAAQRLLNRELSGRKKLLLKQLAEIKKEKLAMKAGNAGISLLQRMENEQRLNMLRERYRTNQQQYAEDFSLARNQALVNLQRLAVRAIRAYGKRHHFTVILGQEVFFASPGIDLTPKILASLRRIFSQSRKHG